eukprot:365655-Chlamydomonas_euryale.AAC.9
MSLCRGMNGLGALCRGRRLQVRTGGLQVPSMRTVHSRTFRQVRHPWRARTGHKIGRGVGAIDRFAAQQAKCFINRSSLFTCWDGTRPPCHHHGGHAPWMHWVLAWCENANTVNAAGAAAARRQHVLRPRGHSASRGDAACAWYALTYALQKYHAGADIAWAAPDLPCGRCA